MVPRWSHSGCMKRIGGALALVVIVLAGCSSSSGKTSAATIGTDSGEGSAGAPAGLGIDQLKTQMATLTGKLGCPSATVQSGSGYAQGAAYTSDCTTPAQPEDAPLTTSSYSLVVFPTAAGRDGWLTAAAGIGGGYVKGQTSAGGFWAVQSNSEDLKHVAATLGGTIV